MASLPIFYEMNPCQSYQQALNSQGQIFHDSQRYCQSQKLQDDAHMTEYTGKGFIFAKLCFYLEIMKSLLIYFLIIEVCLLSFY